MIRSLSNRPKTSWIAAVVALTFAGCGNSNGLVPVTGRVLYKGQPAVGARLHFHRQDAPATAQRDPIPSAVVDEDGSFEVTTGDLGRGVPVGRYAVLVSWPEGQDGGDPGGGPKPGRRRGPAVDRLPKDRLNGRYLDIGRPMITADVTPGVRELDPIELKD